MLTPKFVCESLTIPASTLRRWANRFSSHLSVEEHEPGQHRTYTPDDLATFQTIQELLANGLTYAEIEKRLAIVDQPEPNASTALMALPQFQQAIEEFRANNAMLKMELDELKNWKTEFNKWASLPFWKRIFTPPPNAPERPTSD